MKIINIYNSFFIIIFFLALYGFVYERTLYDITYGKYVQNYFDAGNSLPSYAIEESPKNDSNEYELYEIPFLYEILHRIFKFTVGFVFFVLIPMFMLGIILFIRNKLFLDYKWYIIQLIGYSCILLFLIDMLNFVFD
ncbi:MAG: hypothetical protein WC946_06760 [Bacteroidales bacterium]|jgi:hypothetical protein